MIRLDLSGQRFGQLTAVRAESRLSDAPAEEVCIRLQRRMDGGLRVYSDDVPGLILSGSNPTDVMADVWPALVVLLKIDEGTSR